MGASFGYNADCEIHPQSAYPTLVTPCFFSDASSSYMIPPPPLAFASAWLDHSSSQTLAPRMNLSKSKFSLMVVTMSKKCPQHSYRICMDVGLSTTNLKYAAVAMDCTAVQYNL